MPTTDELAAQLGELQIQVPTIEDLICTVSIPGWSSSGGTLSASLGSSTRFTLMTLNVPVRILSVAVSFEYFSLGASDTSYWTCFLEKGNEAAGFPDIAARSTQNTGANANGAIVKRTPWTFDAAAWGNADVAAGELLAVNWAPTGSVANLEFPVNYTIRYQPL